MSVRGREHGHDGDLVGAVQSGDLDAFSELFRRHYPSVHRACLRRLGDTVEADEVAQATFVRALERIDQCRGERRFGPWVQVIARYLCVDHCRARARVVLTDAPVSHDQSDGSRPEDSLLESEQRDRVRRAIADLPERQRRALTARVLGLRPGEIAVALGLSIGAVDSLLLRARRRLALTYTSMASEGGTAAAATGTSTTASLGGAIAVDHARIADGIASTANHVASAVGSLPGVRPVGGVVSAVVGAALAVGGAAPPAPPSATSAPPPAATAAATAGEAAPGPGGAVVVVRDGGAGPGTVTVTVPGGEALAHAASVAQPVVTAAPPGATAGAPPPAPVAAPAALPPLAPSVGGVPVVGDVVAALPRPAPEPAVPPAPVVPIELPLPGGEILPMVGSATAPERPPPAGPAT